MKGCRANWTRMWLAAGLAACVLLYAPLLDARPRVFLPDPVAGYAIGGFDPVSYFVEPFPKKGNREHTHKWGGVEWVFVNKGNLAAFQKAPEIYAPQYAGCGAFALTEGYATAGNPSLYSVLDGKLFFFHSETNRFLFIINSVQLHKIALETAKKNGCFPRL